MKPITLYTLGWLGHYAMSPSGFTTRADADGMILKALLSRGLMAEGSQTIKPPPHGVPRLPGCPYGRTTHGFVITDRGRILGDIWNSYQRLGDASGAWKIAALVEANTWIKAWVD